MRTTKRIAQQLAAMPSFMAFFDINEVVRGKRLGSGGFSHVDEVVGFRPRKENEVRLSITDIDTREFFAKNAVNTNGEASFAVKFIQPAMMNDENDFRRAANCLANEADLLSKLDHPNIIKLRGFPFDGAKAFVRTERYDGYFLILDRLDETLSDRIESWKQETKRLKNPIYAFKHARGKQDLLMRERLMIALEVASALEYLHSKRIVYRDLKPNNIGLNGQGVVKLFDFGLARPMPSTSQGADVVTGSFQMTGKVGTKMVMAPEVYERKQYNTKSDVYSFALLLWQMLSLERPFARHTKRMYRTRVVKKGERPPIDSSWPMEIQILLRRAWSRDPVKRPTMDLVCVILKKQIAKFEYDQQRLDQNKKTLPNSVIPLAA